MNSPKSDKMTPLARRIAADQNLDIRDVRGSGYAGKICTEDLKNAPKAFGPDAERVEQVEAPVGRGQATVYIQAKHKWEDERGRAVGYGRSTKLEWEDRRGRATEYEPAVGAREQSGYGQRVADEDTAAKEFVMPGFLFETPARQDMAPMEDPPFGKLIEFPKSPSFRFESDWQDKDNFPSKNGGNTEEIQAREAVLAAVIEAADEFQRRLKEILENRWR